MSSTTTIYSRLQEYLDEGKLDLPVLPEVATQVMRLCSDPDTSFDQLNDLIRRDQSLAGNLLRIVNSAMYSPGFEIKTLEQAITRLGFKKVREVTMIISCEGKVFKVKNYEKEVRGLFKHCLAAGAYAQEVARQSRRNVEEAFLCGLMHDVGCPVLYQFMSDLEEKEGMNFSSEEVKSVMVEFHAIVGAMLAKEWSLPDRLREAIAYHHHPQDAPSCAEIATLTNFANDLAHFAVGPREVTEEQLMEHPMLETLNIYPDELDELLEKKEKVIESTNVLG
ncbi:MAG: HDOD domain-containing protein [Verrucomicrobiota bacterium]